MARIVDPSVARTASAAHFHCDLGSIQPNGVKDDLGPFKSLDQMVEFTGKSVEQWRRERREIAAARKRRQLIRALPYQERDKLRKRTPKVDILALLMT